MIVVLVLAGVVFVRLKPADDSRAQVVDQRMADLLSSQQALVGKVDTVSTQQIESSRQLTESFGKSQQQLGQVLADRLNKVETEMNKNLASSSKDTAESLAGLKERLVTIDKAQDNIKALSEQVVSLQHVLDDNPARGAFGEVQLADIVESMLPAFAYQMQAPLANGKLVDCLIKLPDPPGPI